VPYGAAFSVIAGRILGSNESQLEIFTHKFVVHPRGPNPDIEKRDVADRKDL